MKYLALFTLTLIITSLSLSVQGEHVSDPSLVADGAKLYSENCARCHNPRPASDYSKKEWSVVMPHMREKAHMTGKEALAVEAFLASTLTSEVRNEMKLAVNSRQTKPPQELIAQFGCQGCHVIKGIGGNLGPTLDGIVNKRGHDFVAQKMRDPKFDNAASAMPQFPMTDKDIEVIIEFLSKE